MQNQNISKIINSQNVNIYLNGMSVKEKPILAGFSMMKIHHFGLDKIRELGRKKTNGLVSIFSLNGSGKNSTLKSRMSIGSIKSKKLLKSTASSQFSTKVIGTKTQTQGLKTLRIKCPKGWNFQPGQYVEIRSKKSANPAILAIASGVKDGYIEFTGMPSDNPAHPNYCLNCQSGDQLLITGPLGSSFPLHLVTSDTPLLVLGGGTGITALQSVMRSLPKNTETQLIYSAKSTEHLLYKKRCEKWKAQGHVISLTQEKAKGYDVGRITEHLNHADLSSNTLVFICGPMELVLETAKKLIEMGVSSERIYGSLPYAAKDGGPVFRGDHPKMNPTLQNSLIGNHKKSFLT